MKVYKLEVMIIDFDDVGGDIKDVLENANFPNDCISPRVMSIQEKDIEWNDEHPLNMRDTAQAHFYELFRD